MRAIRRAAVTGLFALWLAPLGAAVPSERGGVAASGGEGRVAVSAATPRKTGSEAEEEESAR